MEEQTITNVPVENSQQTLKKNKTKIFSLIALIALCVLVTLSFIFSIEIDGTYIIEETAIRTNCTYLEEKHVCTPASAYRIQSA